MNEKIAVAAILTGGKGKRLGGDKQRAMIAGSTLAEIVFRSVRPLAEEVICVGAQAGLDRYGVPVVEDLFPGADSLGGIATALDYALKRHGPSSLVLCVACDMPFIKPELVEALVFLAEGYDGAVPRLANGYEPLCAVYRARVFREASEQVRSGNLRIRDLFLKIHAAEADEDVVRHVDPMMRSFVNVNRPEDLRMARILAGAAGRKRES